MESQDYFINFSPFLDAKNIIEKFISKYLPHYDLDLVLENDQIIIWENEYFEFILTNKNDNAFFEIVNVEISNTLKACFFVPVLYSDFVKVMKIVNTYY